MFFSFDKMTKMMMNWKRKGQSSSPQYECVNRMNEWMNINVINIRNNNDDDEKKSIMNGQLDLFSIIIFIRSWCVCVCVSGHHHHQHFSPISIRNKSIDRSISNRIMLNLIIYYVHHTNNLSPSINNNNVLKNEIIIIVELNMDKRWW